MAEGDGHGLRHLMGKIEGKLEGIEARLDQADESRTRMHQRMNAQSVQMENISTRLAATETVVSEVRTIIGRVEALERAKKAVTTAVTFLGTRAGRGIKWAITLVLAALLALWREILDFFRG